MPPPIVLFDDERGRFGPITDLRASFEIRTGPDSTVRRAARWAGDRLAALWAPSRLADVVAERAALPVNMLPEGPTIVLLNGRLPLPHEAPAVELGEAVVESDSGDVIVAHLGRRQAETFLADGALPDDARRREVTSPRLLRRPWDVLAGLDRSIAWDIAHDRPQRAREPGPAVVVGDHPVTIEASARLWPGVVIDAEHGPVAIHEKAVVRAHAILCGPCAIGHGATVAEHAVIRGRTVIGPMCKVGGEISGTVFQGWSNKAHDGFLGDAFVGKWVNLGAATTNSNLLNTYGEISMRVDAEAPRERTGRQFLGGVIGDHVKTAIGTRLMTGTVLGTGAMIASSVPPPALVAAFAWLTDESRDGVRRWRGDRFEETMRAMMSRRGREPGPAYLAALRALAAAADVTWSG